MAKGDSPWDCEGRFPFKNIIISLGAGFAILGSRPFFGRFGLYCKQPAFPLEKGYRVGKKATWSGGNADLIYVLNRGSLVEQGNHATLMEKKGAYYALVATQDSSLAPELDMPFDGLKRPSQFPFGCFERGKQISCC